MTMKRPKYNSCTGCAVTFPEPWVAIKRPGVRLCLGEPVEVVTALSHYCVPVYTLSSDTVLTTKVKSYAHYFHAISCHCSPDVVVSYITLPRFVFALRTDLLLRALVLSSPISITEG